MKLLNITPAKKLFEVGHISAKIAAALTIVQFFLPTYTQTVNGQINFFHPYFLLLYALNKLQMTFLVLFIASAILITFTTIFAKRVGYTEEVT